MSLFIAIKVPEDVMLPPLQVPAGARVLHPDEWHITIIPPLAGMRDDTRDADIQAAVGKALAQVPRLLAHCTIYGYSAFPSGRSAKVFYAAVYDSMGRLGLLHSVLGQALTNANVLSLPPRRFTPHVTIAKLDRLTGCVRMLKAANAGGHHAEMPISDVGLYRTVRPGNGPSHYECVSTWVVDK